MTVQALREWFALKKKQRIFNLKGCCEHLGITADYLHDFVAKGDISKQALPKIVSFALEHGWKAQEKQSDYECTATTCTIHILEVVDMQYIESSNIFLFEDMFDDYQPVKKKSQRMKTV